MKHIIPITLAAFAALAACSTTDNAEIRRIDLAEQAFGREHFTTAQKMADSLLLDADADKMPVDELCRLAALFMRLSDVGAEQEVNTAYAARSLAMAYARDPDSTEAVIAASPIDVKAAMALLAAINGASHGTIINGDTVFITDDSIPEPGTLHYHD
ncbi:MAG: hypothetical protein K2F63_05375 [Muribaculaceae bacterium]|nr:hypothetical protein [Muribaculaceae bacterium]MDE6134672.1 hypothetical protein [Muribaculaceae bacterium]